VEKTDRRPEKSFKRGGRARKGWDNYENIYSGGVEKKRRYTEGNPQKKGLGELGGGGVNNGRKRRALGASVRVNSSGVCGLSQGRIKGNTWEAGNRGGRKRKKNREYEEQGVAKKG